MASLFHKFNQIDLLNIRYLSFVNSMFSRFEDFVNLLQPTYLLGTLCTLPAYH